MYARDGCSQEFFIKAEAVCGLRGGRGRGDGWSVLIYKLGGGVLPKPSKPDPISDPKK